MMAKAGSETGTGPVEEKTEIDEKKLENVSGGKRPENPHFVDFLGGLCHIGIDEENNRSGNTGSDDRIRK